MESGTSCGHRARRLSKRFVLKHYCSGENGLSLLKKLQNCTSSRSWSLRKGGSCWGWRRHPEGRTNLAKVRCRSAVLRLQGSLLRVACSEVSVVTICSVFATGTNFAESCVFVCPLNLLKMRFTSCDVPGFGGERLPGWGRSWGTEAGDFLKAKWCSGSLPWCPALLLARGRPRVTEVRIWQFSCSGGEAGGSVVSVVYWQKPGTVARTFVLKSAGIALWNDSNCVCFLDGFSANETQSVSLLCLLKTTENHLEFQNELNQYQTNARFGSRFSSAIN